MASFINNVGAVVGGGDSALEEAIFLTRFAKSVTLVHRRGELRGSKIMQERALANEKIHVAWNSEVAAIHGEAKLSGVTLRDTENGTERELAVRWFVYCNWSRPTLRTATREG